MPASNSGKNMAILTASQLGKSYGTVDIFEGLSFNIPQRARIGLVGPNGVGKTTFLKTILGLRGANLLLLDEPTNPLDLPSQEVLQSMLAEFEGTILLVSHDRFLIDGLATQIWNVNADAQQLEVFSGSYSAFKQYQHTQAEQPSALKPDRPASREVRNRGGAELSKNERQRLALKIQTLEADIAELETKLRTLGERLQNPPEDGYVVQQLGQDYRATQAQLGIMMEEWATLAMKLEE